MDYLSYYYHILALEKHLNPLTLARCGAMNPHVVLHSDVQRVGKMVGQLVACWAEKMGGVVAGFFDGFSWLMNRL